MTYCAFFVGGGDYCPGMWLYLTELDLLALQAKLDSAYRIFLLERELEFVGWGESIGIVSEDSETEESFVQLDAEPEECAYVVLFEIRVDANANYRDTPPKSIGVSWSRKHQDGADYFVLVCPEEALAELRAAEQKEEA